MKYKSLFLVLFLIFSWSVIFSLYKYFYWGIFKENETITLQFLAGLLSIGGIFAYFIGGFFYEIFKEKKYHFGISILSIIFSILVFCIFQFGFFDKTIGIAILIFLLGFFYAMWGILRGILISNLIIETGLKDTLVNGVCNIIFISSLIIGTILGNFLGENFKYFGHFILIGFLISGIFVGIFLKNDGNNSAENNLSLSEKAKIYKNNFLKDFSFIIKKYYLFMIITSIILTTGTILSQKAIEFFINIEKIDPTKASSLLLFSAIGGIFGNIISMKFSEKRWKTFISSTIFFGICAMLFPIAVKDFWHTAFLASVAGVFFGVSYNLIESFFYKKIGEDDKKSYGSASLGVISASIVAILMFLADFIQGILNFNFVYYFFGILILICAGLIFLIQKKSKD